MQRGCVGTGSSPNLSRSKCRKGSTGAPVRSAFGAFASLVVLIIMAIAVTALPPVTASAAEGLFLRVLLNGESFGDLFLFRTEDGDFLVRQEDLAGFPLAAPDGRQVMIEGERFVSLRSLPSATYSFEETTLTLFLTAPVIPPPRRVIDLNPPPPQKRTAFFPRETSAFLNYGLTYSFGDENASRSFTFSEKFGARSGDMLFQTDGRYTRTRSDDAFVRLMSSLTLERRKDLQLFIAGDQFATSGSLGSTVNIGGIGFMKLYRMDPYLIKNPTFGFTGIAPTASQVEVYMDGMLVSRQTVQPGEFELRNLNYFGGARTAEVVIRDAFGSEQRMTAPMYFSDALLKQGLHEYSYAAGFLREQYGVRSSEYGHPVLSAFHRYGVNDRLNVGASVEGTRGIAAAGLQAAHLLPRAGVLTAAFSGSRGDHARGTRGSLAYAYQRSYFGADLLLRGATRDYSTVATQGLVDPTRFEAAAGVHVSLKHLGGVSLGYSGTEQHSGSVRRVASGSYSTSLARRLLLLITTRAVHEAGTEYETFVTLNYAPDRDLLYSARHQRTGDADVDVLQVQKNTPVGEGAGYRAMLERTRSGPVTTASFTPFVQYNARHGVYALESSLRRSQGDTSAFTTLSASGSVVAAEGFFGFARPVSDSFGFVIVDGLPDVKVMLNNEDLGRTDASGQLVIPSLRAYQFNQVTVDAADISMDYTLSGVNTNVSPSQGGGACISFHAARVKAMIGRLVLEQGGVQRPVEYRDVRMAVNGRTVSFPTGKGGEFYFEDSLPEIDAAAPGSEERSCRNAAQQRDAAGRAIQPGTYHALVAVEGGHCRFDVHIPDSSDVLNDLGMIACTP